MDTGREQIDLFLRRCDELMQSKFIIADTKIGELLQAIAASDLLYAFFRDITKDFDYPAAKSKYMNYAPYGKMQKKLLFPEDPAENLAFIFCLLMEFDNKTLDLGRFLQEYFYEDGSFYESFYAFCNQVVKPFRNAVKVMFCESFEAPAPTAEVREEKSGKAKKKGAYGSFSVEEERKQLYASMLPDAKKIDGMLLLNALERAKDKSLQAALLCGYIYFAQAVGRKQAAEQASAELENRKERL